MVTSLPGSLVMPARETSTLTVSSARTRPWSSPRNRSVEIENSSLAALVVRRRAPEDPRPLRPGIVRKPRLGRTRQQLELVHRRCALPVRGAQAVRAGVAAADDDHALAGGADQRILRHVVSLADAVLPGQVVDGEVNPGEFAPWNRQVARPAGAAEHHGVSIGAQRRTGTSTPTFTPARNSTPSCSQRAGVEEPLFDLEFRDAVAQQTADAVGSRTP